MSDLFDLSGKVALVTGGSRGLGYQMVKAFAARGADVFITSRKHEACEKVAAEVRAVGRRAVAHACNVGNWSELDGLVEAAYAAFGKVDILVNNAGLGTAYPATRETPEQFREVIDVNLHGAYWMAQAFTRAAKGGGSIINIGSVLGIHPGTLPQAAYASSKAGLIGLTRDLAAQWTGRKGIRVNCLAPGFFPSEMSDALPDSELAMVRMLAPAGRGGEPAELAAALVFLASDASSYITGVTLPVDGGLTMP